MSQLLNIAILLATGGADFDTEIIPVLTKAGCNAGSCHGAAAGRGGFRLSLYGSEPSVDYESMALELEGRRVNLHRPASSLLLLKATCEIDHGGGFRLDPDDAGAQRLLQWIGEGAGRASRRKLVDFEVTPALHVAEKTGDKVQLRAQAAFDDGSREDVTLWTAFTVEDPDAVRLDDAVAVATLQRRGRHIVVARYLDRVVPVALVLPLSDHPIDLSDQPRRSFVDDLVCESLQTLRIPVSPAADSATLLRRLRLDLTGTLPTPQELDAFVSSRQPDKVLQVVDQLLQTDEFTDYWTYKMAKLLRIRSRTQDAQGARTYHDWLRNQIRDNRPYDHMVRTLLTATGDSHAVGPANFYRTAGNARAQAEFVSELFLGARLRCANCHNHPLDQWKQDDYHGLAAVFARVERGRVISISDSGEVTHPRTGEAAVPRLPGERFLDPSDDGRAALAAWLTEQDNPHLRRALVNRIWKSFFGRGLVEPTDDMRATNPPTHPELLDRLAEDFVDHGYDIRHTIRLICTSTTYGRSAATLPANAADDRFYSHALVRPLEPEVLADALAAATGVADRYGDEPLGTRAIQLFDSDISSESLDILGRCSRESSCETAAGGSSGGLARKLHLINGELVNGKIARSDGRLHQMLAAERSAEEIVEAFYLCTVSRRPTASEREHWDRQLEMAKDHGDLIPCLEDFVWSLLTCREFVTNH